MITGDPITFAIDWELMPAFTYPDKQEAAGYVDFWIGGFKLGNTHSGALLIWLCNGVERQLRHQPRSVPEELQGRSPAEIMAMVHDARFADDGVRGWSLKRSAEFERFASAMILTESYGFDDFLVVVLRGRTKDRILACDKRGRVRRNGRLVVQDNNVLESEVRKGKLLATFARFRRDVFRAVKEQNKRLQFRRGVEAFRLLGDS